MKNVVQNQNQNQQNHLVMRWQIEEEERMYVVAIVGKIRTNASLWAKYIIAYRHCFILDREIEVIERETEEYFRSSLLR